MKKHIISILLVLFSLFFYGQNETPKLPIVTPSQPEAAELGRYGDVPVSKFTGIPNINIPLYTIRSGDIKIPVALSYYAGGIRVDQEATWVGLGWSLSGVSNVITRTVKGKIDGFASTNKEKFDIWNDQTFNAYGGPGEGFYLKVIEGPFNSTPFVSAASGIDFNPNNMWVDGAHLTDLSHISEMIRSQSSAYDWEPDLYTFNFLGYSGSFVYDKDGNVQLLSKDSKLTFSRLFGNGANIGWIVQTPEGFKVEFSESVVHTSSSGNTDYNNVTDWFISKITSPKGKEVLFNYSRGTLINKLQFSETFDLPYGSTPQQGYNSSTSMTSYTPTYLDSITFDEGSVLFEKSNRDDLIGSKKLDKIKIISSTGLQVKEFLFVTDYFVSSLGLDNNHFIKLLLGNPSTEQINNETKRLKLNSLLEIAGGESKTYTFEYNAISLPRKSSFSTDFWGFYNGQPNTSFISDYKGPVTNQIVYTTSLNSTLIYQTTFLQNLDLNYLNISAGNRKPNINTTKASILEKIIYPTKGTTSLEYELHDYSNTELEYNLEQHSVVFDNFLNPQNPTVNESVTVAIPQNVVEQDVILTINAVKFIPTNTPPYQPLAFSNNDYVSINGSITKLIDIVDGSPFNQVNNKTVNISVTPGDIVTLEIHKSTNYFGVISAQFQFSTSEAPLTNKAGGLRIKKITNDDGNGNLEVTTYKYGSNNNSYGILKVPNRFYNTMYHVTDTEPFPDQYELYQSHYTRFYGLTTSTLFYGQSNHVGYSKVIETKGLNNENGYSEYNYYNAPNITYEYPDRPVWLPSYSRKFDGKLLSEKHFSADSKLLKSIDYKYGLTNVNVIKSFYRGFLPQTSSLVFYNPYSAGLHYYPIIAKREALAQKIENNFDINGENPISTITNYYYDNDKHLQLTRVVTTTSDNKTIITKTSYPDDVSGTGSLGNDPLTPSEKLAIDKLKAQHRIAEPIQVETTVENAVGSQLSKNVQRTNYRDWGNNLVLPEFVQTLKGNYSASNKLQDRLQYKSYYANGNPKELLKKSGSTITYIWGYQEQYPIAKIENATYAQIASQVANLQNKSNADNDRTIDQLVNGITTYIGNEGALRQALSNLRNSSILSNAQVTTFTYDPLIGVTSITDPRGETIYYHYDTFNRLEYIIDKNNKVISKNEYNYKN